MSGGLPYNFRGGNRSEYLADYLLSAIGITTPVRRQDDYGFDFYCQVGSDGPGYLTFGFSFMIQIKSKDNYNRIVYGEEDNWRPENLTWLFRNEIPFFIGIVDKKQASIEVYDTTGLWHVYNHNPLTCSMIVLKPNPHPPRKMRDNCEISKIEKWHPKNGDGFCYEIDLGNPLISLSSLDILEEKSLTERKDLLRHVVDVEQQNILYRKQFVRAFKEIKANQTNKTIDIAGAQMEGRTTDNPDNIYVAIREALILQLMTLAIQGRDQEVAEIKTVLRNVPYGWYYKDMYEQSGSSALFDWMDPGKF